MKGYDWFTASGAFDSTRLVDSCGKPWPEHRCATDLKVPTTWYIGVRPRFWIWHPKYYQTWTSTATSWPCVGNYCQMTLLCFSIGFGLTFVDLRAGETRHRPLLPKEKEDSTFSPRKRDLSTYHDQERTSFATYACVRQKERCLHCKKKKGTTDNELKSPWLNYFLQGCVFSFSFWHLSQ